MRRLLAILIGGAAALLGGSVAWSVLRPLQVWESGAFTAGPEVVLVIVAAVVLGAIAAVLSWRALVGPPLERMEWQLVFGPRPVAADPAAGRASPTVGDLVSALEAVGYTLDAAIADDAGKRVRDARREERLGGACLELRERTAPARTGRVLARIPPERGEGEHALGFLDVHGALDGMYEEMGRYVIAALGRLHPELTYNRLGSGLTEEPASAMWAELPARPEKLPRP